MLCQCPLSSGTVSRHPWLIAIRNTCASSRSMLMVMLTWCCAVSACCLLLGVCCLQCACAKELSLELLTKANGCDGKCCTDSRGYCDDSNNRNNCNDCLAITQAPPNVTFGSCCGNAVLCFEVKCPRYVPQLPALFAMQTQSDSSFSMQHIWIGVQVVLRVPLCRVTHCLAVTAAT